METDQNIRFPRLPIRDANYFLPVNDPMQRQPDTTKAKEILGWEAKVSRSEGMKITYEYFKTLSSEELLKEEHKDFTNYIH
jgi:dTDP-glucose 4,6-dehydratase